MFQNWSTKDEIEESIRTFQSIWDEIENTFSKFEWRDDENGRENLHNVYLDWLMILHNASKTIPQDIGIHRVNHNDETQYKPEPPPPPPPRFPSGHPGAYAGFVF